MLLSVVYYSIGDFMHELSNDGAREQFESLLATLIVPAMIKCARVRVVCAIVHIVWMHTH